MNSEQRLKKAVRTNLIIGCLGILILGFQNCSEVNFNANPALAITETENRQVSIFFDKAHKEEDSNIDIVWLVDNSSSMAEETEIIRENLSRFLEKTEMRSNLRLALMSNTNTNFSVELPQSAIAKGYIQIDEKFQMGNALDRILRHMNSLVNQEVVREKSQKIIIFTGDEDFTTQPGRTTNLEFLNALQNFININDLTFYNFVGLPNNPNCTSITPSLRAIQLAQQTGGESYDICKSDWSESFNSILKNIARLAKTEFELPDEPVSNLQVRVNGVLTDRYTIENKSLILDPSNFPDERTYRIQVDYIR